MFCFRIGHVTKSWTARRDGISDDSDLVLGDWLRISKYAANIHSGSTTGDNQDSITGLALADMVAQAQAPLWRGIGPTPFGLKSEASTDQATVIINHIKLVEILMDVNERSSVFSGIVSRAKTLKVISVGVTGTYHGQWFMTAEFQLPLPMVPIRENYFVRYCKKQPENDTWAVLRNSYNEAAESSTSNKLQILQESCNDRTGSYVVYAAADMAAMDAVLKGGNPGQVALLPSGFSILAVGGPKRRACRDVGCGSSGDSLITVAFQSLVHSDPTAELSLDTVAAATKQF
ncbi:LOW QUALITY PROTEIN: hypothetical protein V2J09_002803 [Rumex salicifolius]